MTHWLRAARTLPDVTADCAERLGWLMRALGLEREGQIAQAQAQEFEKLRLALWRLDSLLAPVLAREDSRPFQDYSEMFAPVALLRADGASLPPGRVFVPSPLLMDELPDWMLIHFQVDTAGSWKSPQVFPEALALRMQGSAPPLNLVNRTPRRRELLGMLSRQLPAKELVALVQAQSGILTCQNLMLLANYVEVIPQQVFSPALQQQTVNNGDYDRELRNRTMRQSPNNTLNPGGQAGQGSKSANVFVDHANDPAGQGKSAPQSPLSLPVGRIVPVTLGPMTPFWNRVGGDSEQLFIMRTAKLEAQEICQGVLLDWPQLEVILREEARSFLTSLSVRRQRRAPSRQNSGESARSIPERQRSAKPDWLSPLLLTRAGLDSSLDRPDGSRVGWSLLDSSERRFRFVLVTTNWETFDHAETVSGHAGHGLIQKQQKTEDLHTPMEADRPIDW